MIYFIVPGNPYRMPTSQPKERWLFFRQRKNSHRVWDWSYIIVLSSLMLCPWITAAGCRDPASNINVINKSFPAFLSLPNTLCSFQGYEICIKLQNNMVSSRERLPLQGKFIVWFAPEFKQIFFVTGKLSMRESFKSFQCTCNVLPWLLAISNTWWTRKQWSPIQHRLKAQV